jgi:hypothetical protein
MKCVCGYKHFEDWEIDRELNFCESEEQKKKLQEENGDEEFVHIEGSFYVSKGYGQDKKIQLYACPSCGTIKTSYDGF